MTFEDNRARTPRLPDAGWLPDPSVIGVERYWDGRAWTSRTRDKGSFVERVPLAATSGWDAAAEQRKARRRARGKLVALLLVGAVVVTGYAGYRGQLPEWVPWPEALAWQAPTGPEVDYLVHASDDLTAYLARSMVAQEDSIDVTWYVDRTDGSFRAELSDAIRAVVVQNPAVFVDAWALEGSAGRVVVKPVYLYGAEEAERRRAEAQLQAEAIAASPAVADAADARAKAAAIHDAVIEASEYDWDASDAIDQGTVDQNKAIVDRSQQAYGALVEGIAVCNGYAQAFQLIADAAGVESVIVTGEVSTGVSSGGGHAWNKVLIGGEWLVVDTTWDDDGEGYLPSDEYLLLDDMSPRLLTRTAGDDWVLDSELASYGY